MRIRLRGQKRVPRPPASRTAQAGSELVFVARFSSFTHRSSFHWRTKRCRSCDLPGTPRAFRLREISPRSSGHIGPQQHGARFRINFDNRRARQVRAMPAQVHRMRARRPNESSRCLREKSRDQNVRATWPRRSGFLNSHFSDAKYGQTTKCVSVTPPRSMRKGSNLAAILFAETNHLESLLDVQLASTALLRRADCNRTRDR